MQSGRVHQRSSSVIISNHGGNQGGTISVEGPQTRQMRKIGSSSTPSSLVEVVP